MRYDWDVLNRATLIAQPSGGASYAYRADGQRIEKVEGATFSWSGPRNSGQYDTNYATNRPSSRYYYDGQMGFEDDYNPSGTVTKVTRNLLGARGIDRISITENSATTHGYPLYDGHGNCRAILTKNGTSYGTGNWRTYDVWGSVRSGSATGDPKSRYVASIGHVADDESSLTYMRARYYEPATGRFLSEDPEMDGVNWYVYCANLPNCRVDGNGMWSEWESLNFAGNVLVAIGMLMLGGLNKLDRKAAAIFVRDMVIDVLIKYSDSKDVQEIASYLKFARDMLDIFAERANSASLKSSIYHRWLGYVMAIQGQQFLTDSVFADPKGMGADWWGWDIIGKFYE